MKINPCLWYNDQAEAAVKFYSSVFKFSKIGRTSHYGSASSEVSGQPLGSVMMVDFQLEDLPIQALNGGPHFKFNPSMSFFVSCTFEDEIQEHWKLLSKAGKVRMELAKYPWAEKYGWTTDQFGVEWQLMLSPGARKIAPAFLFVDKLFGQGEEAVKFYTSIFPNSKIESMAKDDATKSIAHCSFSLNGQHFALMEGQGQHGHEFNEAFSLVIGCDTQKEIDHYWSALTEGGSEGPCGWLKDKFGVSWQVSAMQVDELMADPSRADRVMQELLKMKKPDLETLMKAAK